MFNDLSIKILFGVDKPEDGPRLETGETILDLNKKAFDDMIDLFLKSPFNLMTGGLFDYLNLHPTKIKLNKTRADINRIISREFEKRHTVSYFLIIGT